MALGKGRNKRSSGNYFASTATTVVFVGLCILGVWMLTPNSLLSPDTAATRTAVSQSTNSFATNADYSSSKLANTKQTFQDNPGDLPEDVIKADQDDGKLQENPKPLPQDDQKDASSSENSNESNSSTDEAESDETNNDEKKDLERDKAAAESDRANIKDPEIKESVKQAADPGVDENLEGLQGNVSGESSVTGNQQTDQGMAAKVADKISKSIEKTFETIEVRDQIIKDDQQLSNSKGYEAALGSETKVQEENQNNSHVDDAIPEKKDDVLHSESATQSDEGHENPKDTRNMVSDEENERRVQRQQQQEDRVKQNQPEKQEPLHDQSLQNNENENENESKHNEGKKRRKKHHKASNSAGDNAFPRGQNSEIPKESTESKKAWSTQADQSEDQKERRKGTSPEDQANSIYGYSWQLCNVTAGPDYIPCLDNEKAISKLRSRGHYEHRERHCPEEAPTCLVPVPQGYKRSVEWPHSRDKIWYHNVPHTKLAEVKGHQNWVKVSGEFLTFPGGGTQFIHGALHYIDFIQEAVPEIAWGKHTRTVLDVGCGVASFGGFLFERDVLTMSFAPKDEHEAQVQFALERGIPAISAVMGTQRLPFPSSVFDLIHCARCRVPWHVEGGALLLELNRMLRPGGYFVWSATPVYQKLEEDVQIWNEMSALTISMCWELVTIKNDKLNSIGAAIYHKPDSNECYEKRNRKQPPMCKNDDDPNAAWYVPLQSCMHRAPVDEAVRGSQWPQEWPRRLQEAPYWLNRSQMGIYGKPAPDDFTADYEHWQRVVSKSYLSGLGISWSNVRNFMDMRAVYGGFAAALKDLKVWVINVVNIDSPDTLPIIYERGLFGIYHDWCESFSTYPRTYDLLHADQLFSRLKKRCKLAPVMAEIDRIVKPGGKLIVRDETSAVGEVENLLKSLHWEVHLTFSENRQGILNAQKSDWRPDSYAAPS